MAKGTCRLDRQKRLCPFEVTKYHVRQGAKWKGVAVFEAYSPMIRHLVSKKNTLRPGRCNIGDNRNIILRIRLTSDRR